MPLRAILWCSAFVPGRPLEARTALRNRQLAALVFSVLTAAVQRWKVAHAVAAGSVAGSLRQPLSALLPATEGCTRAGEGLRGGLLRAEGRPGVPARGTINRVPQLHRFRAQDRPTGTIEFSANAELGYLRAGRTVAVAMIIPETRSRIALKIRSK
jgi:hypothetical protein